MAWDMRPLRVVTVALAAAEWLAELADRLQVGKDKTAAQEMDHSPAVVAVRLKLDKRLSFFLIRATVEMDLQPIHLGELQPVKAKT
jgi:hypothetical protein